VATLRFTDGSTARLTFRASATKTETVTVHGATRAEREGYSGFIVESVEAAR
jgi:hypothetical protein